jgi:hypothetical protein
MTETAATPGDGDPLVIGPESKLNEILQRYPNVGPILVQEGRGWVNRRGDLYAQYPDLTVAGFAELNGLDVAQLVRRVAAAAEARQLEQRIARRARTDQAAASLERPPVTIGYTGSYSERDDDPPGSVPVVFVQSSRGPE